MNEAGQQTLSGLALRLRSLIMQARNGLIKVYRVAKARNIIGYVWAIVKMSGAEKEIPKQYRSF